MQSPINIVTSSTVAPTVKTKLQITQWDSIPQSILITNSGYTINMIFSFNDTLIPTLYGGPANDTHRLVEIHYHFGENKRAGSEHHIDGHKYAAEAHMVFYNAKYSTYSQAQFQPDGLVVVARFFEIYDHPFSQYGFVRYLKRIQKYNSEYVIKNDQVFTLRSLFGSLNFKYYSYKGSLTTPNCYESVTWIIIKKPLGINDKELQAMRELDGFGRPMAPNYRPINNRNGRVVTYYRKK